MDSIEAKLHSTKWTYADHDDRAMHEISRRVAQVGKAGKLTTYTELIQGLIFHLPTLEDGRPFQIDTLE